MAIIINDILKTIALVDARRPTTSPYSTKTPQNTFAFLVSISWLALTASPGYCSPLKKILKRAQKSVRRTVISLEKEKTTTTRAHCGRAVIFTNKHYFRDGLWFDLDDCMD